MEVEHVKAHRTKKEKEKMTQFDMFVTEGNEKADELATAGAMLDEGFTGIVASKASVIMLIETICEWPTLCNRIVSTAKAAGGVRRIGLLRHRACAVQCSKDRNHARCGKLPTVRASSGPRTRAAWNVVSGSRRFGTAPQSFRPCCVPEA